MAQSTDAPKTSFHMTPDEFRRHGHAVVDWIADYYERVESYPVLSPVKPGEIRAALPKIRSRNGESFDAMLADVNRIILPGITHWQSPNFFAYFPSQQFGAVNSRRTAFRRAGRAGHAVGDQPGVHGTRNARARLAGRDARLARGNFLSTQQRRRRDSGHGIERLAVRAARRRANAPRIAQRTIAAATATWSPTPRRKRTRRSRKPRRSPGIGSGEPAPHRG